MDCTIIVSGGGIEKAGTRGGSQLRPLRPRTRSYTKETLTNRYLRDTSCPWWFMFFLFHRHSDPLPRNFLHAGERCVCSMLVHGIATSHNRMQLTFSLPRTLTRALAARASMIVTVVPTIALALALSGVLAMALLAQTVAPAAAATAAPRYSVQGTVTP